MEDSNHSVDVLHQIARVNMLYIGGGGSMGQMEKAEIFMSGRSQAVRIPSEFQFSENEVYIRRDPVNGDIILSQSPVELRDIFAALDKLGVPDDFLSSADRAQLAVQQRQDA